MASKAAKDQSAEDILKQLHNEDEGSDSDGELDLGLGQAQPKAPAAGAATASSVVTGQAAQVPEVSPLTEEKERHKKNLMQDLYDQISDDEDDDEGGGPTAAGAGSGLQSDNPF